MEGIPLFLLLAVSGDVVSVSGGVGGSGRPYPTTRINPTLPPSTARLPRPVTPSDAGSGGIIVKKADGGGESAHWAPWSSWSACSKECLRGESQARHRACLDADGSTLNDLKACLGQQRPRQTANVDIRLCPCNLTSASSQLGRQGREEGPARAIGHQGKGKLGVR